MTKAVVKQKINDLYHTTFVQKWVFLSKDIKDQLEQIEDLSLERLNALSAVIFAARYRAVHDIAIALNEIVDTFDGDMEMQITKECEWDGYVNGTEKPITAVLTKGTIVNMLEFLEAPHEGLIFQITQGEGPKGKHFNITMDEAFEHIELLVELVNNAYNRRLVDKELDIEDDMYLGEITPEIREKLESKYGEIKEFVPAPPLTEEQKKEMGVIDIPQPEEVEEETDGHE